jgi:hypothetical protein
VAAPARWHRRFFRDLRESQPTAAAKPSRSDLAVANRPPQRVELRSDSSFARPADPPPSQPVQDTPRRRMPAPTGEGWSEPATESQPAYALYRPRRSSVSSISDEAVPRAAARAEARREM